MATRVGVPLTAEQPKPKPIEPPKEVEAPAEVELKQEKQTKTK